MPRDKDILTVYGGVKGDNISLWRLSKMAKSWIAWFSGYFHGIVFEKRTIASNDFMAKYDYFS